MLYCLLNKIDSLATSFYKVNFIFIYLISFHPTKQGGTGRELLIDKKEKGRELIECLVPKVC